MLQIDRMQKGKQEYFFIKGSPSKIIKKCEKFSKKMLQLFPILGYNKVKEVKACFNAKEVFEEKK